MGSHIMPHMMLRLTNYCSLYSTLNLQQRSISSCGCMDLELSAAGYHICSITSRLLLSPEDILLRILLTIITVVVLAK